MSPELWKNQRYGPHSDVWALGVLLYEMAALRHPFLVGERYLLPTYSALLLLLLLLRLLLYYYYYSITAAARNAAAAAAAEIAIS